MTPALAMDDSSWERTQRDFELAEDKQAWRAYTCGRTGVQVVVRFSGGRFVARRLGQDCVVHPSSLARVLRSLGLSDAAEHLKDLKGG